MKYLSSIFLSLLASTALAQTSCLDLRDVNQRITGSISRQNFETYLEVPFDVPTGTQQISLSFDYDRSNRTVIDLGLLDPNGFRGWSGGNKSSLTISANSATASYSTGPLVPGTWQVLLGVPNIREGQTANYEIQVALSCTSTPNSTPIESDRGADWYVGDLHTHTGHSDGSCENSSGESVLCPAFKNLETAGARNLDFIALTDHNSVSQNSNNEILQSFFNQTLLIPGREVTTFYGHANVFGTTEFIDFRLERGNDSNADFLFDQVDRLSGLLSINHPGFPSGEDCMGCGWVLENTDYSRVSAMEVVNAGYVDELRGEIQFSFWHERLNEGFKITGVGGSDSHLANRLIEEPSAIGNPSTWIYAQELSVLSILDGIRSGNVFIETAVGSGKITSFSVNGQPMGSTIEVSDSLSLEASWESDHELSPRWIHQGNEIEIGDENPVATGFLGTVDSSGLEIPGWIRADLVDDTGVTRIVGNPVYLARP